MKCLNLRTHVPHLNIIIYRCALFTLNCIFFLIRCSLLMLIDLGIFVSESIDCIEKDGKKENVANLPPNYHTLIWGNRWKFQNVSKLKAQNSKGLVGIHCVHCTIDRNQITIWTERKIVFINVIIGSVPVPLLIVRVIL